MSGAIQDAISAARAANAEHLKTETSLPTTTSDTSTAGSPGGLPAVGGAPRSLTDFLDNAGMAVECYVSVSENGISFGKDKKFFDDILVDLTITDGKAGFSLRVNAPGGVVYHTSWDGATEARSRENWQKLTADAKKIDPRSYVSDLYEMPVTLKEAYTLKDGKTLDAGTVVGLSLSYQRVKVFQAWAKKISAEGRLGDSMTVRLTQKTKIGGGQEYGVFEFNEEA